MITILGFSEFFLPETKSQDVTPQGEVVASYAMVVSKKPSPIRVTKIDVDAGTAILTPTSQLSSWPNIARGETLLLLQDEKTLEINQVIRANIDEILEKGESMARLGKKAVKAIRLGPVFPIHPFDGMVDFKKNDLFPVPSRKYQQIPEVVLIGDRSTGIPAKTSNLAMTALQAEQRARSINHLKQIMLALHNFEALYGHFPPAVIYGPDGRPWHSWRTLILGFLGPNEKDLYNRYDFSQPWDAPANKAVVETPIEVYKDPVYGNSKEPVAHYGAIVGKEAAFLPDGAVIVDKNNPLDNIANGVRKSTAFTDGTSTTIMIAPMANERKVLWAKPEDISFSKNFPALGKPDGIAMPYASDSGKYRYGQVAFVDGSVHSIRNDTDMRMLNALITPGGGEVIDFEKIPKISTQAPIIPKIPIFMLIRKPDGSYTASFQLSRIRIET